MLDSPGCPLTSGFLPAVASDPAGKHRRRRAPPIGTADLVERTSESPHLRLGRLRELADYREILLNLIRKELKVKYTASVLGAVWSLLNPVVFLGVFSFVGVMLGNTMPNFPVYLLSGLLAWNVLSTSLQTGSTSVIDNANLVKKVYFPREILPLSSIGVALVDYVLQTVVLLLFMLATGTGLSWPAVALLPLAIVTLIVFTTGITMWASALNVRYRDVQHLIGIGLLVWFWLTPIVYSSGFVQQKLQGSSVLDGRSFWLYVLNPMAIVIQGFQRALYGDPAPVVDGVRQQVLFDWSVSEVALALLVVLTAASVLLWFTWRLFFRMSGDFAEEL
ncbi:MAG: ABC transporter permease [Actinomycetota bacterium]